MCSAFVTIMRTADKVGMSSLYAAHVISLCFVYLTIEKGFHLFVGMLSSCLQFELLDDSICEMEVKKMFLFSQQIDVEAEYKKREQTNKAQINLVVIGKIMATSSCI